MEKKEIKNISAMIRLLPMDLGPITVEDLEAIYSQEEKKE